MKRVVNTTNISPNLVRYRIRLEGELCARDTNAARQQQILFLRALAEQPELLACGLQPFQKVLISHNGSCWVAEAEAEVTEENVQ